ncbi:putative quinol monooxygenase [Methanobrevibacter sp.]|uniref:putative quinol monooxygenase n=1 Tax=Methanobrevibacter sp. TaxID=66852 RepID=UPI0025FF82CA|nr:putative quinol monooxygenase [Methanobrevibacter sp.]MBQ6512043.1 antibiotic biosynthesis monooxygenase [Methanobrevibacter sp.]
MIFVLAKAIPKDEDAANKIVEFAQDLIENSRKEDGNVDYNLYCHTGDSSLLFVEQWESKEILDAHLQTEHFLNFGGNIADLVAQDLIINVYEADSIEL